ncbi:MAG TPA: hypothetical protein VMZ91_10180 [Candidatus Paceibacterota bacterium]|nr:hypothetical protein [Candidatus Paceibacterota bacterium]
MKLTKEEKETLIWLLKQEIKDNLDYVKSLEGEEKECWESESITLKKILVKIK